MPDQYRPIPRRPQSPGELADIMESDPAWRAFNPQQAAIKADAIAALRAMERRWQPFATVEDADAFASRLFQRAKERRGDG